MEWLASHSIFCFMYYAVELVLRLFKASQERYIPFGGISIHLKDFKALERKLYKKRDTSLMHPLYIIIGQQNTLMVSISGHSDLVQTLLLVKYSKEHIMGMNLNASLTTLSVIPSIPPLVFSDSAQCMLCPSM